MDLSHGVICRRTTQKRTLFTFLHFYDVRPEARKHAEARGSTRPVSEQAIWAYNACGFRCQRVNLG